MGLVVLTWFVPEGEFEKQIENGRKVIIPGTYHQIPGWRTCIMYQEYEKVYQELSVQFIFLFQSMFTFLVPSGLGQAALTVPIVALLSHLLDVGRQTVKIAFHLGNGLFRMLVPISGVTMGVLSISEIPYTIWIRWFIKLMLILFGVSMLLLIFALKYFSA